MMQNFEALYFIEKKDLRAKSKLNFEDLMPLSVSYLLCLLSKHPGNKVIWPQKCLLWYSLVRGGGVRIIPVSVFPAKSKSIW